MEPKDIQPIQKPRIGEILVSRNIITKVQLQEALEVQKKEKTYLGEILLKLGYVEERDIVVALVVQCNIPYIAVNKYTIAKEVLDLIPETIARKYQVLALDLVGDVLSVVMANPLDETVKTELELLTKCKVNTFIATRKEITEAIDQSYSQNVSKQ